MALHGTLGRRIIFSSGGVIPPSGSLSQFVHGNVQTGAGATFGSPVTVGHILVAVCYERNGAGGQVSLSATGAPADGSWTTLEGPGVYSDFNNGAGMTLQAKIATTSFAGPFYTTAIAGANVGELVVYEVAGVTLTGAQHGSQSKGTASPANAGSFTCDVGDVVILGVEAGQGSDPTITPGAFTEDWDALFHAGGVPWAWAGNQIVAVAGSVAASVVVGALAGGNSRLATVALRLPVTPLF